MKVWQVDCYRRPLHDQDGKPIWELVVCDPTGTFKAFEFCSQSHVNTDWLTEQFHQFAATVHGLPERIQVFRPQALHLVESACQLLGIAVEATRHTSALKHLLQERAIAYPILPNYTGQPYEPLALEQSPPVPLPENLWGEQWRFAAIASADLVPAFADRPIPIRFMPDSLLPISLQIPSTLPIPGVVIDGGRQSMRLARWLQDTNPASLNYIPGSPDGLILEAGLSDRWVLTTFEDDDVIAAAKTFQQRQHAVQGLHFLLVQPDDSGMTYSGFWLLHRE